MFDNLFAKAAAPRPAPEQQQQVRAAVSGFEVGSLGRRLRDR
jgi:hypothetical protein